MPSVRVRVGVGVGAWIVGAATATGLSLFAVSYLSEDPQSPQGSTLSQAQVSQALASMTADAGSSTPPAVPSAPASSTSAKPTPPGAASVPSTKPSSPETSAPAAPARSTPAAQPVDRRLSADAGTVVAQCQDSTVYLVTWTPAQGYGADVTQRGPARLATIVFAGYGRRAELHIGCQAGAPVLVGGDDGWNDH
jgi:hypothetical protein